jgi:hypothetical protein
LDVKKWSGSDGITQAVLKRLPAVVEAHLLIVFLLITGVFSAVWKEFFDAKCHREISN